MNKLILIGNGFDLAHGLSTSYTHFIDDFWKNLKENYLSEEIKEIVFVNKEHSNLFDFLKPTKNFKDFKQNLIKYSQENNCFQNKPNNDWYVKGITPKTRVFYFRNKFFEKIIDKNSLQNWVDIENEYFLELKKIVKEIDLQSRRSEELWLEMKRKKTLILNKEFQEIKELLKIYIQEKIIEAYDFKLPSLIDDSDPFYEYLNMSFYSEYDDYKKDFPYKEDWKELGLRIRKYEKNNEGKEREIVFLNFNYTPTLRYYLDKLKVYECEEIKIHGNIDNMIFGFGDETDNDYQLIENMNENEYLENFKSFQYSLNPNYNNFFTFLDSDKFHIYIMGHSCGLSDRVLLNKIFEHKNCRGIKVFYHQKENGSDNYLDIIRNISRHFKDKQSMRRKIVSKEFSSPLPQNVRFKKISKEERKTIID